MAHIIDKNAEIGEHLGDRPQVTDAWLPANAKLKDYARRISHRAGRVDVRMGPNMAPEAGTAQFMPKLRSIEINTEVCAPGMGPDGFNPTDQLFRARFPMFFGAFMHETAHSLWSRWTPVDFAGSTTMTQSMIEILVALEESRIEKKMIERYKVALDYLPAIVWELLLKEYKGAGDAYSASMLVALVLLRAEAGVISRRSVAPFREDIEESLDAETVERLIALGQQYHDLTFPKYEALPVKEMERIAREWLEALGIDPEEEQQGGMACHHGAPEGEDEGPEGAGEGSGGPESGSEGPKGAQKGEGDSIADKAAGALHDEQMKAAERAQVLKAKAAKHFREQAIAEHEVNIKKVKPKLDKFQGGLGPGPIGYASHVDPQDPDAAERHAANVFAKRLSAVVASGVARDDVKQQRPGRKLRARGMVDHHVQAAQGRAPRADRFFGKRPTETDDLPLKVGILTDISGSMGALAKPLATTTYVLGNGAHAAGADLAATVFGVQAGITAVPGKEIKKVPVIDPADGHERPDKAMELLDGMLDFMRHPDEALTILIIASDGCFGNKPSMDYMKEKVPALSERGVTILHLDFDNGNVESIYEEFYGARMNNPLRPIVINPAASPVEIAKIVGDRILLEAKKRKNKKH